MNKKSESVDPVFDILVGMKNKQTSKQFATRLVKTLTIYCNNVEASFDMIKEAHNIVDEMKRVYGKREEEMRWYTESTPNHHTWISHMSADITNLSNELVGLVKKFNTLGTKLMKRMDKLPRDAIRSALIQQVAQLREDASHTIECIHTLHKELKNMYENVITQCDINKLQNI